MDWEQNSLRRLHEIQPDHAYLEMVTQQKLNRIIELLELAAEPRVSVPRLDIMKLLQPPYIWIILGLGMWGMQLPLPQAIEVMKLAIGAP